MQPNYNYKHTTNTQMELTGKIIAEFNERGGVSNRTGNEWKAKSYVMELPGEFPRKLVFDVFGVDRLQAFNIQIGETLTVHFDIDAHEYNGRWFNNIRAFDVRLVDPASIGAAGVQPAPAASAFEPSPSEAPAPQAPFPPQPMESESTDDLPF